MQDTLGGTGGTQEQRREHEPQHKSARDWKEYDFARVKPNCTYNMQLALFQAVLDDELLAAT